MSEPSWFGKYILGRDSAEQPFGWGRVIPPPKIFGSSAPAPKPEISPPSQFGYQPGPTASAPMQPTQTPAYLGLEPWRMPAGAPPGPAVPEFSASADEAALADKLLEANGMGPGMAAGADAGNGASDPMSAMAAFNMSGKPAPRSKATAYKDPHEQDYQALVDKLGTAGAEALLSQKQGIEEMQANVDRLGQKEGTLDLSPMLALNDSWFGTGLQKGYERPQSPEEREAQILALEDALQKRKGQLSATEIGLLESQMGISERGMNRNFQAQQHADDMNWKAEQNQLQRENQAAMLRESTLARIQAKKMHDDSRLDARSQAERESFSKNPLTAVAAGMVDLNEAISNYAKKIQEVGDPSAIGEDSAEYQALYNQITLAAKNGYGLGALAGADMQLIEKNVRDFGSPGSVFADIFLGKDAASVLKQVNVVRSAAKTKYEQTRNLLETTYPGSATLPQRQVIDTSWAKANTILAPKQPAGTGTQGAAPQITPQQAADELARRRGGK